MSPALTCIPYTPKESAMDREHVKGFAEKTKGSVKEGAGKLTGDKDMQAEGKVDKAKGRRIEKVNSRTSNEAAFGRLFSWR
jgi:uncharacterized protein YjbJ (UPF0337 family)